ncbi:MAG TPA: PleD family two-component system response regulator [Xanthobacteraceae bacterium]|jgi:two-component system cell cycle response regulator|nr:PleD family two-component system response regulator [Xanthobacteraceae bacterium]
MSARVLVVDDNQANLRLLQARLSVEYFEVLLAANGQDALDICARSQCDIVLLDVMMPGIDGFEVARHIKSNPATHHIPIIMVTALDQPSDRVKGLEAGADDFLTKPIDDIALIARVRSLARLKMATDEMRMRVATSRQIGVPDPAEDAINDEGLNGRILVVEDHAASADRIAAALAREHTVGIAADPQDALFRAAEGKFDLMIVSLDLQNYDALRLIGQIRSLERTRYLPILLVSESDQKARLLRALDLGANDYLSRIADKNEICARVKTQVRRRRFTDRLRDNLMQSMELAIIDPLTGLYNRRYMESHAGALVARANDRDKPLSLLILDIDHFKSVNDSYGHEAGDEVLREFASRLRSCVRGVDLACRLGGEEFVVVMPDTDLGIASRVAERIRRRIAGEPFSIDRGARSIEVTISVGLSSLNGAEDTPALILKRADEALYRAKNSGRNRVVADAA